MNTEAFEAALSQMIHDLSADLSDNPAERRDEIETMKSALTSTWSQNIDQQDWVDAATAEAKIGL